MTAWNLATVHVESEMERNRMMLTTPGTRPLPTFHCMVCNGETPVGETHQCNALPKRWRRRLDAYKRLQNYQVAQKARPVECNVCGEDIPPRTTHACHGRRPDRALAAAQQWARDADAASLVAALERHGLKVAPQDH